MGGASPTLEQLRAEQQRILKWRAFRDRWYHVVLVVIGGLVAAMIGQVAHENPKGVYGGIIAAALFFVAAWRLEIGLVLVAVMVTPFIPSAAKLDYFYLAPVVLLLFLLFFVVLVRLAFRIKETVVPSIRVIWPLICLLTLAFISEIMAQATWQYGVPHVASSAPVIVDELVGLTIYSFPLITILVACAALTNNGKWTRYVLLTFMLLGFIASFVLFVTFRHIGGDVYSFRYSSPNIGWMPLEALAHILGLGSIVSYGFVLGAPNWRTRMLYAIPLGACLLALYLSLENSWWTEVALAMFVMTLAFSWRLLLTYAVIGIPFLPLVYAMFKKLQDVKAVDTLRLVIWQDMLRVWSKRPILGVGPGNVWSYDGVYSQLPQGLRDIGNSGLGVAHEGYLQTLAELGPLGVLCQVSFLAVLALAAYRLFRRSREDGNRDNLILGLVGFGLVFGCAAGDLSSSYFFLPPRQSLHVVSLPMALTAWVVYGCVIYKDKVWRMREQGIAVEE